MCISSPHSRHSTNVFLNSAKILYYNAFTEDLFYWDNADVNRKLIVRPNNFTGWVLEEQGQENNIVTHFQRYTSNKLTPRFNEKYIAKDKDGKEVTVKAYSEITFSIEGGNEEKVENIKISKGEESNFIWCVFYSLLEQVVEVLNVPEPTERETNQYDNLKYVFIDDPVSSLDDTHLIELAVNIAELIKSSKSELKFIITTHNSLFYNVLFNELKNKRYERKRLDKLDDGTFLIEKQSGDSPFSYHLFLLSELEKVLTSNIQKYHFNFLRNILEKTATFLGYANWRDLLPEEAREAYYNRIINLYSHSKHSGEEISIVKDDDKKMLKFLLKDVTKNLKFNSNVNDKVNQENEKI